MEGSPNFPQFREWSSPCLVFNHLKISMSGSLGNIIELKKTNRKKSLVETGNFVEEFWLGRILFSKCWVSELSANVRIIIHKQVDISGRQTILYQKNYSIYLYILLENTKGRYFYSKCNSCYQHIDFAYKVPTDENVQKHLLTTVSGWFCFYSSYDVQNVINSFH